MKTFCDLFCGSGGTSCGFVAAGFTPVCAVDFDKAALKTYAQNFPCAKRIEGDIRSEQVQAELLSLPPVDCVIMCPPCQAFSARNLQENKSEDPKNLLPLISARLVVKMRPKSVFMEEVVQCRRLAAELVDIFSNAGYDVSHTVLFASDYGVPQKRRRFILTATRRDAQVSFTHPPTCAPISAGEALSRHPVPPMGPEVKAATRERILELRRSNRRLIGGNYALMDLSKPSPTIHTQITSSTGPYTIERGDKLHTLSIEEAARLQSYPPNFAFVGSKVAVRKQIGNSVPPMLAAAFARQFRYA